MRRVSVERGIGCAAIIPAALIGLAGLADGVGPRGWRGFSEFFGWAVVCIAASLLIAALLARTRRSDWVRFVAMAIAIIAAVSFAYMMNWLGLDAPMSAKRAFTSSLQIVGAVAAVGLAFYIGYSDWSAGKRR